MSTTERSLYLSRTKISESRLFFSRDDNLAAIDVEAAHGVQVEAAEGEGHLERAEEEEVANSLDQVQ